jgi:hypothetical protein
MRVLLGYCINTHNVLGKILYPHLHHTSIKHLKNINSTFVIHFYKMIKMNKITKGEGCELKFHTMTGHTNTETQYK